MLMFKLPEYSDNPSIISGNLWKICRDELNDEANEKNVDDYWVSNKKATSNNSFSIRQK